MFLKLPKPSLRFCDPALHKLPAISHALVVDFAVVVVNVAVVASAVLVSRRRPRTSLYNMSNMLALPGY